MHDPRRAALAVLTLVPLLACFACGSDEAVDGPARVPSGFPILSAPHEATCAGYAARLRACGLVTEGSFGCDEPDTEADRCELGCLTSASCALLWDFQCRSVPAVLDRCLSLCNAFTCESGERLPLDWQCDGEGDCRDDSDEAGCPVFECASGEIIAAVLQCNWATNCSDGSDEAGCVGFDCASGGAIHPSERCDGRPQCPDGSDEVGCPSIVCASTGEALPASWRCDQIHDCLDGSDELGCAELLCR